MLQCVAVCCSVWQRVCRDSHRGPSTPRLLSYSGMSVAVCALQCTAVCSVLQCVTVCCSALQCVAACGKRRTVTLKQAFNSSSFDLLWYSIFVDCATLHHTATFGTRYLCCSMYVAVCCRTCVAVCCSVLQVCCSVWIGVCRDSQTRLLVACGTCVTVSVLQCVAVCCSVLQCVAMCCSVLRCVAVCCSTCVAVCCSTCVTVYALLYLCCSVLQCAAACCSVCCSVWQYVANDVP